MRSASAKQKRKEGQGESLALFYGMGKLMIDNLGARVILSESVIGDKMKLERVIDLMWESYARNPVVIAEHEGLREAFNEWAKLKIADGLEAEARAERNIVKLDRSLMYKIEYDGEDICFCTDDIEEAPEFCDTCETETESREVIEYGRSEHYCVRCKGQK